MADKTYSRLIIKDINVPLDTIYENMDNIAIKKFNKEELLERFSQVIDKANKFVDDEEVQRVKKLFINVGTDKESQQAVTNEFIKLQDEYCAVGDILTQTALMMAITGNSII